MPTRLTTLIAVVALAVCEMSVRARQPPDATAAPRVSMAAFKALQATGQVLVVDVRSEVSYKAGHIPGAISIPVDAVARHVTQIRSQAKGRPVVTYCSCPSEHTSAEAALALLKKGLKDVRALVGGYTEWVATGGEIER